MTARRDGGATVRQLQDRQQQALGPLTGLPQFTDVVAVAAGTTGQVFRARQPATDRLVAVKVISLAGCDPRVQARFDRELATAGRVSAHPFLVTVLDHGVTAAGYPYLVMPWYERGSLADELARRGTITVPELLATGIKIAAGLDHAHREGILHRDVKPANILLSGHGESVLADFGGALDHRRPGTVSAAYTPVHAAPELLRGEPAVAGSDVWSLASTLSTALAGRRPFAPAHGSDGLAGELSRALLEPPSAIDRPDAPAELTALLAAGLAKQAGDRPTAIELAAQLQCLQLQGGLPVTEIPRTAPSSPSAPMAAQRSAPMSAPGRVAAPARQEPAEPQEPATIRRAAPAAPARRRRPPGYLVAGGCVLSLVAAVTGAALIAARPASPAAARAVATVPPTDRPSTRSHVEPLAAQYLSVIDRSSTTITLRWRDVNDGAATYLVIVEPAAGGPTTQKAGAATTLTVRGLRPRAGYCFRVATGDGPVTPVTEAVCSSTL